MADARKMQTENDTELQEAIDNSTAESKLPNKIRGVINTIVTVYFFVVCGFLLWFLVGIVVRSLTDNDAV
jgi:TRAP-type C4-dicarboxylate transport system permease small subunit